MSGITINTSGLRGLLTEALLRHILGLFHLTQTTTSTRFICLHSVSNYIIVVSLVKLSKPLNLIQDTKMCGGRSRHQDAVLCCPVREHIRNKRPPGLIAPLLRFWHLLGNPPKNTTKGRDLIFNEGIRLLNMADTSLDRFT